MITSFPGPCLDSRGALMAEARFDEAFGQMDAGKSEPGPIDALNPKGYLLIRDHTVEGGRVLCDPTTNFPAP